MCPATQLDDVYVLASLGRVILVVDSRVSVHTPRLCVGADAMPVVEEDEDEDGFSTDYHDQVKHRLPRKHEHTF